jgi:hypothetical protein
MLSNSNLSHGLFVVLPLLLGTPSYAAPVKATMKTKPVITSFAQDSAFYEGINYNLKSESMIDIIFEESEQENLVPVPVIHTIKAKFKKPVPLEFKSVEDEQGFI